MLGMILTTVIVATLKIKSRFVVTRVSMVTIVVIVVE